VLLVLQCPCLLSCLRVGFSASLWWGQGTLPVAFQFLHELPRSQKPRKKRSTTKAPSHRVFMTKPFSVPSCLGGPFFHGFPVAVRCGYSAESPGARIPFHPPPGTPANWPRTTVGAKSPFPAKPGVRPSRSEQRRWTGANPPPPPPAPPAPDSVPHSAAPPARSPRPGGGNKTAPARRGCCRRAPRSSTRRNARAPAEVAGADSRVSETQRFFHQRRVRLPGAASTAGKGTKCQLQLVT
jgi:hypothetical protein